jgi:hypothetical protein
VKELIDRLTELPENWEVRATKSGRSLEAHEPAEHWWKPGHRYGYVFTDTDRPIRYQTIRNEEA